MLPGIPTGTAPEASDLTAALTSATWGLLTVPGRADRELSTQDLRALADAARITLGAPRPDFFDPPGSVRIALEREGERIGAILIHPDFAVRWIGWRAAADLASPEALAEWLFARGAPEPKALLKRSKSPTNQAEMEAFLAAAPPSLRPHLPRLAADPWACDHASYSAAWEALRSSAGSTEQSVFTICAWLAHRRGPWSEGPEIERIADGLLRTLGVHEAIAIFAKGIPAPSRPGAARFLVDNVRSRGWDLKSRLPEPIRAELVDAARAEAAPEDALRTARLLIDEGPLAPEGTTLIAAAQAGSFRRITTAPEGIVASDGGALVHVTKQAGRKELLRLLRPDTPLAARGQDIWFTHPSGLRSLNLTTGATKDRSAPWFGLPARKMASAVPAYSRDRDAAFSKLIPSTSDRLNLRIDSDEREAYETFGGDLPSALRLPQFWACDIPGRRLIAATPRAVTIEIPLKDKPIAIGATPTHVHVLTTDGESVSVTRVTLQGEHRIPPRCVISPEKVLSVHLVKEAVWLRLTAPLGDVLVELK